MLIDKKGKSHTSDVLKHMGESELMLLPISMERLSPHELLVCVCVYTDAWEVNYPVCCLRSVSVFFALLSFTAHKPIAP